MRVNSGIIQKRRNTDEWPALELKRKDTAEVVTVPHMTNQLVGESAHIVT